MLGLGKEKAKWQWSFCGKHPIATDYFSFNINSPLLKAFATWVDEGFAALPGGIDARQAFCFWRFWAKGVKKGHLVFGLLKASSDRIGRPYPFLIMGAGNINEWEKNWALLPAGLESVWQQIEYIASKRFDSFDEFTEAIGSMRPPGNGWLKEIGQHEYKMDYGSGIPELPVDIRYRVKESSGRELKIPLDNQAQIELERLPILWSLRLKMEGMDVPQAFFIGGTPDKTFLIIFHRSLNSMDFVHLWSVGEEGG